MFPLQYTSLKSQSPDAKVYTTMKSTITGTNWHDSVGKEYRWKNNGTDGLRSYSFNSSNPSWNYAKIDGTNNNGYYTFTDSSTGKPSARRGNLYNWTAATLGSSLVFNHDEDEDEDYGKHAADSICPRGWQLPATEDYDPDNKSWGKLYNVYGVGSHTTNINRSKEPPLEYLPVGYYAVNGFILYRTEEGRWWTDTAQTPGFSYAVISAFNYTDSTNDSERGSGFALRCGAPRQSLHHHEKCSYHH